MNDYLICNACGPTFDPHTQNWEIVGDHFVCGACLTRHDDDELAEKLDN